jgi:hypothetical protein
MGAMEEGWALPYSEDGQWWWSGDQWLPVRSSGDYRWNGQGWERIPKPRFKDLRLTKWLLVAGCAWLLAAIVPWVILAATHAINKNRFTETDAVLLIVDATITVLLGLVIGLNTHPWKRLVIVAGAGTFVLTMVIYVATNPTGPNSDPQGAPLGYAVVFIALGIAISSLLAVGVLFGLLSERGHGKLTGRSSNQPAQGNRI